jgi:hypothetical protein
MTSGEKILSNEKFLFLWSGPIRFTLLFLRFSQLSGPRDSKFLFNLLGNLSFFESRDLQNLLEKLIVEYFFLNVVQIG